MTYAPSNEEFRVAERQAAPTTIEAVMYSLRERGEAAFAEDDCQGRLRSLSKEQLREVVDRLVKLRPRYPAITDKVIYRLGRKLP